jgi:hypothetical protein
LPSVTVIENISLKLLTKVQMSTVAKTMQRSRNSGKPMLQAVAVEVRQSVIDVQPPIRITEEIAERYYEELKLRKKYGDDITSIVDVTPHGNFVYGGEEGAEWLRIEVDNRHITNERAIELLMLVIGNCL